MNRTDSGFVESLLSQPSNGQTTPLHRSNTAPHRRRTAKAAPSSVETSDVINMSTHRPASEKRPRPSNHRSASSSENSTARSRSKGRGHDSKLSSRRTSFTIVDPSRPARHYRVKSSQPLSPASQDVDDVLALHFRSCSLFSNPSYQTNSALPSPTLSHQDNFGFSNAAPRFSMDEMAMVEEHASPQETESACVQIPTTTTHWISPNTRKRDYERIDRANTGLRGLVRRVVPRCVSGPPERFYEKDQSDAGSVRRYRLDVIESRINEKDIIRLPAHASERPKLKSRWTCF
ncbi:uncharacterized protein EKO05_0000309 [Ascochyta rabiei]|uniref:Uncharacterized protein n=1 Tax=Didymella rabiei TaxID=5454 RepID=A0A162VB28_DIDRA|nr:uncharacterized protein EKO05_0000309 [Ascochyta rabiei]KZM18336.1 hypothetical protein ST47_g10487 [Ascochyta rabiei]UPX09623.1 hypothetical protein EKO05_0000309 [Ascochyta rabiei]